MVAAAQAARVTRATGSGPFDIKAFDRSPRVAQDVGAVLVGQGAESDHA